MRFVRNPWLRLAAPAVLLLIMLFEITSAIRLESVTWDEGDHLFSGYESLRRLDHSLNPEHPPLAKMVAAIPLLSMHLKVAPQQGRWFKDEAYYGGRELIFRNTPAWSSETIMFRARMAVSIFTFALAIMVFLAGSEMFSLPAGLIAMTLFAFEPSILTNGAYVTTDETVACMFFAAIFAFYRYVRRPTTPRLLVAGLAAGLVLAAKHSGILLLPMLILLAIGELILQRRSTPSDPTSSKRITPARLVSAIVVISAIAIAVLWAFYYFRFNMRPDGSAMSPSLANNAAALKPYQDKGIMLFARFHLLPESYLYGLVDVMAVADQTPSYIFGKVYAHGVWFYFPVVVALKWTIGAGILLLLSFWAAATGRLRRPREVLFLTIPPALYFTVASASPLNIGVRHILPIFAFLLVLAAGGAWALIERDRRWSFAVAILVLAHIVSSARAFPNYLPYANELWGGPSRTNQYLSDSATDWAQQLISTKLYLDQHHITHCYFAYFATPYLLPADYGIPCKLLPTPDTRGEAYLETPTTIDGPILISYGSLNGFELGTSVRNAYQSFFLRKPDAAIADGVAVYNGTFSVPLASALQHLQAANNQMPANQPAKDATLALHEATLAITTAPDYFDAVLAMADALRANNKKPEATAMYQRALAIATSRMEPSARKDWTAILNDRLKSVT